MMVSFRRRIALIICPELAEKPKLTPSLPIKDISNFIIWKHGRRPDWWHNLEVREFLTSSHRQMLLKEAVEICNAKFGAGTISISGLNRYWLKLDEALALYGNGERAQPLPTLSTQLSKEDNANV